MQNSLPKLIRDFFGNNPNFTPTFKYQLKNHTTDNSGNIIPAPGGWTPVNLQSTSFDIFINSLYGDATDLSLVATIIHEVFHAHLMNEVRILNGDSAYIRRLYDSYGYLFPTVFAQWLQNNSGIPSGSAHHQAIATMFRGLIAHAINHMQLGKESICRLVMLTILLGLVVLILNYFKRCLLVIK